MDMSSDSDPVKKIAHPAALGQRHREADESR
jgi:hypothetical protein